jgi:small subunit ribosomal protein S6
MIFDPDLPDDGIASVDEKLKRIVAGNGGAVLEYTPWGKKKLAYPVKRHTRGHYTLMEYAGDAKLVGELERNMRLDERVLKFITVKLADRFDPEAEADKAAKAAPAFSDEEEGAAGVVAAEEAGEATAEGEFEEGADDEGSEGEEEPR